MAGLSSVTHRGTAFTTASKLGSQKNAALNLSLVPAVTTLCTVLLKTPLVHRSHRSPTLHTSAPGTCATSLHVPSSGSRICSPGVPSVQSAVRTP